MEAKGTQRKTEDVAASSVATSFTTYGFDPLLGLYRTNIEPNGRVVLPSALRYPYDDTVVVMPWTGRFLMIQTPHVNHLVVEDMKDKAKRQPGVVPPRRGKRAQHSSSRVSLDKQFRFVIPPELRELAGIREQIVVCGAGESVEIWSAERYESDEAPFADDASLYFETFDGL